MGARLTDSEPVIVDAATPAPAFYADGAVVEDRGETVRVLCYADFPVRDGVEHRLQVSITFTRAGFYRSLRACMKQMLPPDFPLIS